MRLDASLEQVNTRRYYGSIAMLGGMWLGGTSAAELRVLKFIDDRV
jgi:hypothetical protein